MQVIVQFEVKTLKSLVGFLFCYTFAILKTEALGLGGY